MDNTNEKNETNVDKTYTDPITGKFKEGNPGGGRPSGSLDFKTKWINFIEKVAKQNNMTPNEIDEQLLAVAFKKAKDGDYSFYRDTQDRVFGKPLQKQELSNPDGNLKTIIINKGNYNDSEQHSDN